MPPLHEFFPPRPAFTEKELPDLTGKIIIITGGAAGIGFELAKILYEKNATIYIATRSADNIKKAVESIKTQVPTKSGRLESLLVDLSDLRTIKPAVQQFLERESRLDVLFHNAGTMLTPVDATSAQGHELQMAIHAIGPHLITHLFESILRRTARESAPTESPSVRVIFVASLVSFSTPKNGIIWDAGAGKPTLTKDTMANYMQSKTGAVFLAHEWAKRFGNEGVATLSIHPGLVKTGLQRHQPMLGHVLGFIGKPAKFAAYTELFAGFSPEITADKNGSYVIAWGRLYDVPSDIAAGMKSKANGGSELSQIFWNYCEQAVKDYL